MNMGIVLFSFLSGVLVTWLIVRKRMARQSANLRDSQKAVRYFQEQPQRDIAYWKDKESAAVEEGIDRERQRIANDLNDELLRRLGTIQVQLEGIQLRKNLSAETAHQINLIHNDLAKAIESARPLVWHLALPELEQKPLSRLLRDSCQHLDASIPRSINFRLGGAEREWSLNDDAKLAMFRMVQEAVQNAIKYADAWHIHVGVDWWPEGLEITVQDDGAGIIQAHKKEGYSLSKLTTRAQRIGASVWYEDNQPRGTRVRMKLPTPNGKKQRR
jgi:signal transduction histidine kinase